MVCDELNTLWERVTHNGKHRNMEYESDKYRLIHLAGWGWLWGYPTGTRTLRIEHCVLALWSIRKKQSLKLHPDLNYTNFFRSITKHIFNCDIRQGIFTNRCLSVMLEKRF